MGIAPVKGQNLVCGMEWQWFCPVARLYEADTENAAPGDRAGKEEFNRLSGKE